MRECPEFCEDELDMTLSWRVSLTWGVKYGIKNYDIRVGETETGEIWESKRSGEVECGLGKGTAVYKCTISTVYLWFCRLYHFCCVSIFLNANYIHSKCPTFENMKTKLKFIYLFF